VTPSPQSCKITHRRAQNPYWHTDFELAAAALAEQVTALLDGETTIETACRLVRCCFKSGLQSGHRYISESGHLRT